MMHKAKLQSETALPPAQTPEVREAHRALIAARQRLAEAEAQYQGLFSLQHGDDPIANAEASLAMPEIMRTIHVARVNLTKAERAYESAYEDAKTPWRACWQAKLQAALLDLIDALKGDVFEANEALRLLEEEAALAGAHFSPLHMHRLEENNLSFWIGIVGREVGLPPEF